jgi:hypothetical protein
MEFGRSGVPSGGSVRFHRPPPPSHVKLWLIALLVAAVVYAISWIFFQPLLTRERQEPPADAEAPPAP